MKDTIVKILTDERDEARRDLVEVAGKLTKECYRTRKLEEALVKALRFIPPSMHVPKTLDAALAYFAGSPADGGAVE